MSKDGNGRKRKYKCIMCKSGSFVESRRMLELYSKLCNYVCILQNIYMKLNKTTTNKNNALKFRCMKRLIALI